MAFQGGQAFLALYSTYKNKEGEVKSRIIPYMRAGAMITTTRNDVQYIVTEYGVAWLKGFNLTQRAERLINIAHPDFRDELTFEAKKLGYL